MAERRLFFSLWPSERQREALRDPIKSAMGPVEGKAVLRGNWHVTLVFLGNVADERLPALQEIAATAKADAFRLRFDRLDFWPRPKIACLLASSVPPELQALVGKLETAVAAAGLPVEERIFRPHLTVARNARPFAPEPLAQPVMLEWSGFELMESVTSPRGVQYLPVKSA